MIANEFFPVNPRFTKDLYFNIAKLKCLKNVDETEPLPGLKQRYNSPIAVYGDYDSTGTQTFDIFFSSCETLYQASCKKPQEVTEWLKHKYVLMFFTERKFSQVTGKVIEQTNMVRIPIDRISDSQNRFALQITHLTDLNPGFFPFKKASHQDFYSVVKLPDQHLVERLPPDPFLEYYPNRLQITFEIHPEQMLVQVVPYFGLLEVIAVVGGLGFGLFMIVHWLLAFYQTFKHKAHLIKHLYYVEDVPKSQENPDFEGSRTDLHFKDTPIDKVIS